MIRTIIVHRTDDGRSFESYEEAVKWDTDLTFRTQEKIKIQKESLKKIVEEQRKNKRKVRRSSWRYYDPETGDSFDSYPLSITSYSLRYYETKIFEGKRAIRRIASEIKRLKA